MDLSLDDEVHICETVLNLLLHALNGRWNECQVLHLLNSGIFFENQAVIVRGQQEFASGVLLLSSHFLFTNITLVVAIADVERYLFCRNVNLELFRPATS